MGSSLRVTGSTLWAPGTAALDPSEAGAAYAHEQAEGFPTNTASPEAMDETEGSLINNTGRPLYTSSVEMVTTPDTYPIWRTKQPVVMVSHTAQGPHTTTAAAKEGAAPSGRRIQHHYYRYLVVSPGAAAEDVMRGTVTADDAAGDEPLSTARMISTSNEDIGSTPVMQWEDPFCSMWSGNNNPSTISTDGRSTNGETSVASMTSSIMASATSAPKDYRNLPYRTIDIDISTGQPLWDDAMTDDVPATRMDHWNAQDDVTFRPYRIREVVSFRAKSLVVHFYVQPYVFLTCLSCSFTDSSRKSSQGLVALVKCRG